MAATSSMLARGETVAGFRVEEVIGIGGMAIVYKAEQLSLGRMVALKVLSPQLGKDDAFRERFRREGRHLASLQHPNVVAVYDSGEAGGRLYLAMRLVEGPTLAERMQFEGLSADETLRVLVPIAYALDAAHGIGLVHRDVKPQNILLGGDHDPPCLADFGVAKAVTTLGLTATGAFVGSVNYASPEQIQGEPATAPGDIYALTAVLYQCLAGRVPYPRDTDAGIMHAHLHEPPPTVPALPSEAAKLDAVIARGMAKDPSARYPSAGELLEDARVVISGLSEARRCTVPAFSSAVPAPPAVLVGDGTEVVSPSERAARRSAADNTTVDPRREPAPEPDQSGPPPPAPEPASAVSLRAAQPPGAAARPAAPALPAPARGRRVGWPTDALGSRSETSDRPLPAGIRRLLARLATFVTGSEAVELPVDSGLDIRRAFADHVARRVATGWRVEVRSANSAIVVRGRWFERRARIAIDQSKRITVEYLPLRRKQMIALGVMAIVLIYLVLAVVSAAWP